MGKRISASPLGLLGLLLVPLWAGCTITSQSDYEKIWCEKAKNGVNAVSKIRDAMTKSLKEDPDSQGLLALCKELTPNHQELSTLYTYLRNEELERKRTADKASGKDDDLPLAQVRMLGLVSGMVSQIQESVEGVCPKCIDSSGLCAPGWAVGHEAEFRAGMTRARNLVQMRANGLLSVPFFSVVIYECALDRTPLGAGMSAPQPLVPPSVNDSHMGKGYPGTPPGGTGTGTGSGAAGP